MNLNPVLVYYNVLFAISVILLFLLILRWQVQLDVDMTLFFVLVPITIIGYIKLAVATTLEAALLANAIAYIGGCFLELLIFLVVCTVCHIRIARPVRAALFAFSFALYGCVLTTGSNNLFYRDVKLGTEYGVSYLIKDYGPLHNFFYPMLLFYVFLTLGIVIYNIRKSSVVSIRNLKLIAYAMTISVLMFFMGRFITKSVEVAPLTYVIAESGFIIISYRIRLYSISGDIAANVLERGADGLICLDLKKNLLVYNATAVKIFPGLEKVKIDHPLDDRDPDLHRINQFIDCFSFGESELNSQLQVGEGMYTLRIEHLKDNKRDSGFYIILTDITAQHRYNAELREAKDAAEAADAAKTQFLAQMSHEIRTPINAILGMNEMIIRESADPAIQDYADGIRSSGHNLLFLINSILDFSKIEDGKMEIIEEEYETLTLLMNLENSMFNAAEAKNLKLITEVDPDIPLKLIGDDVRISQVMLNLLSNAIKYTDEGSVTMKIACTAGSPDETKGLVKDAVRNAATAPSNINIRIEVKDTGIGIRQEDMKLLFEEFARLDLTRNHRTEGTGLGMPIIVNLLKLMGSEIHVDSVYGEGSTFWFDICQKVADPTPIGDYRERVRIADTRSKQDISLFAPEARILVVDDNALNLKVTRGYLKICGIVPDEATGGREAIELMRENAYDVVLLDHMMPGMDGIETLKVIRSEGLASDKTVIVALTANAIEGSRELYIEAGFDDYISKPMDLKTLAEKLEGYLSK